MTDAHSLLFLSCDIVGSTQHKQQYDLWQGTFLGFYRQFPQLLGELTRSRRFGPGFELWKPVGDELIFHVHVTRESEVYEAIRIWLEAMQLFEASVLDEHNLATKGGAFIATFPGPDSESSIPRNPTIETSDRGPVELNNAALEQRSSAYLYDFFGPSIDTGFRIFAACEQRYFTLSVEVALALAQYNLDGGVDTADTLRDLLLFDVRALKGVWRGREYPIFALDRDRSNEINRAMEALRSTAVLPHSVVNLCRACLADSAWPSGIYLRNSAYEYMKVEPVDSLAGARTNDMEGAETPVAEMGSDDLEPDAPMGPPPSSV